MKVMENNKLANLTLATRLMKTGKLPPSFQMMLTEKKAILTKEIMCGQGNDRQEIVKS
jgi:hypothetical protein